MRACILAAAIMAFSGTAYSQTAAPPVCHLTPMLDSAGNHVAGMFLCEVKLVNNIADKALRLVEVYTINEYGYVSLTSESYAFGCDGKYVHGHYGAWTRVLNIVPGSIGQEMEQAVCQATLAAN
jgi:hypothetical protein